LFKDEIICQIGRHQQQENANSSKKRKHDEVDTSESLSTLSCSSLLSSIRLVKPLPSLEEGMKVFEFFSGIGGMRLSLPSKIQGIPITGITAFDINRIANSVSCLLYFSLWWWSFFSSSVSFPFSFSFSFSLDLFL
jgi:hypothetical protein